MLSAHEACLSSHSTISKTDEPRNKLSVNRNGVLAKDRMSLWNWRQDETGSFHEGCWETYSNIKVAAGISGKVCYGQKSSSPSGHRPRGEAWCRRHHAMQTASLWVRQLLYSIQRDSGLLSIFLYKRCRLPLDSRICKSQQRGSFRKKEIEWSQNMYLNSANMNSSGWQFHHVPCISENTILHHLVIKPRGSTSLASLLCSLEYKAILSQIWSQISCTGLSVTAAQYFLPLCPSGETWSEPIAGGWVVGTSTQPVLTNYCQRRDFSPLIIHSSSTSSSWHHCERRFWLYDTISVCLKSGHSYSFGITWSTQ